ncbi:MAG: class D sortase [Clostridia bacterium]|nr:class D sortase [Clostridia bacterium]
MKKKLIGITKVILLLLIIAISVGLTIFLIKYEKQKEIQHNIDYIYNIYNNDNSQDILNKYITENYKQVGVEVEGTEKTEEKLNAIAVLEIPKIGFKDIVLEGTTQDVLANGIGLFEHSPILNGNVCLAGHNTTRFFAKLNELEIGDELKYSSCLGTREYLVSNKQVISETDWSMLQSKKDNYITLITCVKNQPEVRLCVQAIEKI